MSDHIQRPGGVSNQPGAGAGGLSVGVGSHNLTEPTRNEKFLFWASFLTLIAAGMGFSIRGDLLSDWGRQFSFTQSDLGEITGMGLVGFGVTIIFFSFFADVLGYGKLMIVAFLLHVLAVLSTLAAPYAFGQYGKQGAFWALYVGQLCFSFGNGTCEAVINPLTASLFPRNKTHWLNILHAGWPGGLVLGALLGLAFNQIPNIPWEVKWGIVLLPMLIYGGMMVGRRFPRSEATASGLTLGDMMKNLVAPLLIFLFFIHALIGYVELGTDSWIINITETVLANKDEALLAFIWTNVLMFTLRFFAGPIVHKISPLGLLFVSALLGTLGLYLLGQPFTNTTWAWLAVVSIYGVGKTFYWPTMLGVISERFPRGGALALGFSGGIGMLAAGALGGPGIGYKQDYAAMNHIRENAEKTYARYRVAEPGSPIPGLPKIAGLDNGKIGILEDYMGIQEKQKKGTLTAEQQKLKLERDLELVEKQGGKADTLQLRLLWWRTEGLPHATEDAARVKEAQLYGGKTALTWTATVPAAMAVCFLILIIYFKATGGYHAEVLTGHAAEDEKFTGGTQGPGEG